MAGLPAVPVVEVVVLDHQFRIEELQQPGQGIGRRGVDAQAAVAGQLGEHDVLVAHPPLVETHRQAHQLHGAIRQERDAGDIEELLLGVGV